MTWPWTLAGMMNHRQPIWVWAFAVCFGVGCASNRGAGAEAAAYPSSKIAAEQLSLVLRDERPEVAINETNSRMGLAPGFKAEALARLARLTSGQGLELDVVTSVVDAGARAVDSVVGRKMRIEVTLSFQVRTQDGTVLRKGKGASWAVIPEDEATLAEVRRVFDQVALAAFDQYWADDETISKLNAELEAFAKRRKN